MTNRSTIDHRVDAAVHRIESDYEILRTRHKHAFKLAINEAKALAWQTPVPDLVLPILAQEKLKSLVAWQSRQNRIFRNSPRITAFPA